MCEIKAYIYIYEKGQTIEMREGKGDDAERRDPTEKQHPRDVGLQMNGSPSKLTCIFSPIVIFHRCLFYMCFLGHVHIELKGGHRSRDTRACREGRCTHRRMCEHAGR